MGQHEQIRECFYQIKTKNHLLISLICKPNSPFLSFSNFIIFILFAFKFVIEDPIFLKIVTPVLPHSKSLLESHQYFNDKTIEP